MSLEFTSDKLVGFSLKLAKVHRAALPNAIRFTLTDSAKDVKFRTLKKHANKQFDVKKQSFFRAFSAYEPAKGFNISKMKSTAGMIKKAGKSVASTEIGQQQHAGIVHHKSYIKAQKPKVSSKTFIDARKKKPLKTEGNNYAKTFIEALKTDTPMLVTKNKRGVLVKAVKLGKTKKKPFITKIISGYEGGRKIKLTDIRPFLNNAALESGKLLDKNFVKHAKKQVAKFLK